MNDFWVRMILGICLISFLAVLRFTSPYTFKQYLEDFFKFRSLVFVSAQTLMFLQLFNVLTFKSLSMPMDQYMILIGLILAVIGSSLAIWAKLIMKKSWGVPAQHDIKKQNRLVTSGPFAHTRNPIYVGLLLLFFGVELSLGSYLALLIIPFAYLFYRAVLVEEKLLAKHFGKEFKTYTSRVRRFL